MPGASDGDSTAPATAATAAIAAACDRLGSRRERRDGAVAPWYEEPEMAGQRESSDAPESRRPHADRDIDYMLAGISPRRRAFNDVLVRLGDGTSEWLRRHWLGVVNGTLATFIGVAVATPLAYAPGLTRPASAGFPAYRFPSGQLPSHSFFCGGLPTCLWSRCLAI